MTEKPGWKTSEFWLKLAALLLSVVFASGALTGHDTALQILGIASSMLGALGYTGARTFLKAKASDNTVVAVKNTDPT